MKKLLKTYGLKDDTQYWDMIEESFINGQRQQAHSQFCAMPKVVRKAFVKGAICKDFSSDYSFKNICSLIDLI